MNGVAGMIHTNTAHQYAVVINRSKHADFHLCGKMHAVVTHVIVAVIASSMRHTVWVAVDNLMQPRKTEV